VTTKIKETAMINQTMIIGPKINCVRTLFFSFSNSALQRQCGKFILVFAAVACTFPELQAISLPIGQEILNLLKLKTIL